MQLIELIDTLKLLPSDLNMKRPYGSPHSYRGYYQELALEPSEGCQTVGDLIDLLIGCLGKTYEGYKGGDFSMNDYSDVYIAYYGSCGAGVKLVGVNAEGVNLVCYSFDD